MVSFKGIITKREFKKISLISKSLSFSSCQLLEIICILFFEVLILLGLTIFKHGKSLCHESVNKFQSLARSPPIERIY